MTLNFRSLRFVAKVKSNYPALYRNFAIIYLSTIVALAAILDLFAFAAAFWYMSQGYQFNSTRLIGLAIMYLVALPIAWFCYSLGRSLYKNRDEYIVKDNDYLRNVCKH